MKDVIFTWRLRGVLNDTIWRNFGPFFFFNLDPIMGICLINRFINISIHDQRNFTGGRCDFYLKIERCFKRHNSENFYYFSWDCLRLTVNKGFYSAIKEIFQVEDVIFTWRSRGVLQTQFRNFSSITAVVWRLWISERRLNSNYLWMLVVMC